MTMSVSSEKTFFSMKLQSTICPQLRTGRIDTTVFFGVLHPQNVHNLMGWVQEYEEKIQRKRKIPFFMYSIHV